MREINVKNKKLPVIGIGTWRTGDNPKIKDQEIEAIRYGLTHGANLIDTAEMYGSGRSERLIGQALDQLDRKNIFIISKFYPQNATPSLMRRSLENSLKRLGTDYLDLYLLHWRGNVPLKDTVSGLRQLKSEGLIKEWGVSNFDLDDMKELFAIEGGNEVFANEDYYNLGGRGIDFDLLPWQRKKSIPLIAYTPAARGDEFGRELFNHPLIQKIAQDHNASPIQILLAWAIRDNNTIAIPQTTKLSHMKDNLAAADIVLTKDELEAIDKQFPKPDHKVPLTMR